MPGCGMSPSPRDLVRRVDDHHPLARSSASTRATSRSMVVLPTPGRPSSRMLRPDSTMSRMIVDRAVDGAADAAGEADDLALAIADARRCGEACARCRRDCRRRTRRCARQRSRCRRGSTSSSERVPPCPGNRASGARPRSNTTSSRLSRSSSCRSGSATRGGSAWSSCSMSSVISLCSIGPLGSGPRAGSDEQRLEGPTETSRRRLASIGLFRCSTSLMHAVSHNL